MVVLNVIRLLRRKINSVSTVFITLELGRRSQKTEDYMTSLIYVVKLKLAELPETPSLTRRMVESLGYSDHHHWKELVQNSWDHLKGSRLTPPCPLALSPTL